MFKKLLGRWRHPQANTKSDLYNAGQDYMAKLLEKYPEQMAFEQAHKVDRDPSNYFDAGVLDYIRDYKDMQRGRP